MFIVVIILVLFSVIQTLRVGRLKDGKKKAETEREQLAGLVTEKDLEVTEYKNKYGNVVARVSELKLSHDNVIRLKDSEHLELLKQFEGLKKRYSNLVAVASFDMTLFGNVPEPEIRYVPCKDSLKVFEYKIQDKYNNVYAKVVEEPIFDVRIAMDAVVHWEKKKKTEKRLLFWQPRPRAWTMQVVNYNQHVKMDTMRLIKVEQIK